MHQLGRVAVASGAGVLLVFVLSCWLFDGRPFKSPAAAADGPAALGTAATAGPSR